MPAEDPSPAPAGACEASRPAPATTDFRWQAFFQRAADPLFLLNRRRRILFVNRAWESLTRLSAAEARGLACMRRRTAPDDPWDLVIRAICCPPPEVLQGNAARTRRLVPGAGTLPCWWDVDFLPFGTNEGVLGILGRIVPVPEAPAPLAMPLPERLVAVREARRSRFRLDCLHETTPALGRVIEQARLAGRSQCPVLIRGEPGTGKAWLARTIHALGAQGEAAFAALDCTRLPPKAIASVLFGGAATAPPRAIGSIYLREPSCLPRDLQTRLCDRLRAEDDRNRPRILVGTCKDPAVEVQAGRLLETLACTLGVISINLPPLRERMTDLPRFVEQFLVRADPQAEGRGKDFSAEAWEILRAYSWPENFGELYTVVRDAALRAPGGRVEACHLPASLRRLVQAQESRGREVLPSLSLDAILEEAERRLIVLALQKARGNRSRAADWLSVSRPRLLRRMEALAITGEANGGSRPARERDGTRSSVKAGAPEQASSPLTSGMRHPQVLVYEKDTQLADGLRRDNRAATWSVHEPRSLEGCLELLCKNALGVLVLRPGKDLVRELVMLEQITWVFPESPAVVVLDQDQLPLASLAWELGASYVLPISDSRPLLADLVDALIQPRIPIRAEGIALEDTVRA
jgi:DNA-binding NtrC family response regulator